VVEANRLEMDEVPPPPRRRWTPHKWSREELLDMVRSEDHIELYVSKLAEEKMRNHAIAHSSRRYEVMGLMLGSFHTHGDRVYTMVRDVVTTDLEASSVRVRFKRGGFEQLFESLDSCGFEYIIVGWYHSHPGHGCFLSPTDVETQRTMFSEKHHSALVIDPILQDVRAFFLDGDDVAERPFVVYWDEYQNPYYTTAVKRRRKRSDPDGVTSPEGGLALPKSVHEDGNERVEED
jgi:proteasome lid subunit RPN8/RPN11